MHLYQSSVSNPINYFDIKLIYLDKWNHCLSDNFIYRPKIATSEPTGYTAIRYKNPTKWNLIKKNSYVFHTWNIRNICSICYTTEGVNAILNALKRKIQAH